MVRPLPETIRGCTHVNLTEAYFSLANGVAFVRGALGTLDPAGAFVPDTDLKECYVTWQAAEFAALTDSIDGEALIVAAGQKHWGFTPPPEP